MSLVPRSQEDRTELLDQVAPADLLPVRKNSELELDVDGIVDEEHHHDVGDNDAVQMNVVVGVQKYLQ